MISFTNFVCLKASFNEQPHSINIPKNGLDVPESNTLLILASSSLYWGIIISSNINITPNNDIIP